MLFGQNFGGITTGLSFFLNLPGPYNIVALAVPAFSDIPKLKVAIFVYYVYFSTRSTFSKQLQFKKKIKPYRWF
jgi:hypothetical protein